MNQLKMGGLPEKWTMLYWPWAVDWDAGSNGVGPLQWLAADARVLCCLQQSRAKLVGLGSSCLEFADS